LEESECAFGVFGKNLDEQGFNGIYLGRFGFRNVGRYLILK
jgi:hypothetical protein